MRRQIIKILMPTAVVALLTGCSYIFTNAPPSYKQDAEYRLEKKGVDPQLQTKLFKRKALTADEVELIRDVGNAATLYYLAGNTNVPQEVLAELGTDKRLPVRQGYLRNPAVPVDDVLKHRVIGEYDLLNDPIARNPSIPPDVLRAMYENKETGASAFARNPSCPEDILWDIYRNGTSPYIERPALAGNPNAPVEMLRALEQKGVEQKEQGKGYSIQAALGSNPTYIAMVKRRENEAGGNP